MTPTKDKVTPSAQGHTRGPARPTPRAIPDDRPGKAKARDPEPLDEQSLDAVLRDCPL
jgi:hypothetical protein